jgi:hypothetical protein
MRKGRLMSDVSPNDFSALIKALSLKEIRPMSLVSERKLEPDPSVKQVTLNWKLQYADGDPVSLAGGLLMFRPRYEFALVQADKVLFQQISTFVLLFQVLAQTEFSELWTQEPLQGAFKEKQIPHIIWPIFRQQVMDGMSRLGMAPVTLPWLS